MNAAHGAAAAAKETARIEAFSDGVFAIAITLLVLDLKVPHDMAEGRDLAAALWRQWPAYLAFVTSFATICIMWINHHRMFTLIGEPTTACSSSTDCSCFCCGGTRRTTSAC